MRRRERRTLPLAETDAAVARPSLPPDYPVNAYLWIDTFRPGAPVMEFGATLHVGADVAPPAGALAARARLEPRDISPVGPDLGAGSPPSEYLAIAAGERPLYDPVPFGKSPSHMRVEPASIEAAALDGVKFRDPDVTADGARRASVALDALRTLWFNTGTLCNLTCRSCYIESSPTNDRLAYLPLADVVRFVDEIAETGLPTREIGLTGGEPFMNPDIVPIVETCLDRGFSVLVLTNAMRPMMKRAADLLRLRETHGDRLAIRVSLDHYGQALHEMERGDRSWKPAIAGFAWLVENGFNVHVCGRTCWDEGEESLRAGFARLFARYGIDFDVHDPVKLTLLPEMDETADVPEITEDCWNILGISPDAMMCASQRMVVKRKGEPASVVSCTLLPYEMQFDLGRTLAEAAGEVKLNHPHCARFCVLGGGACSSRG